jgi:carboxypeptidase Taq
LNKITEGAFSQLETDEFVKASNLVKPSLIRIEADEVTYSLHIIIRFEIERDLFAGKIEVSELPSVWNQKYKDYLGLDVPDDAKGVMQDTHWASGYFGYFPSYALGNIYDGMFLEKLNKDMPDWLNQVGKGEIKPTINWLKENVHQKSSLYDPRDLAEKVTGMKFSAKPFLNYLEDKFSKLFGF